MKTLAILLLSTTAAFAGPTISQSQCQALWQQVAQQSNEISQAQASNYISTTNFGQVDANNDGRISQSEFMTGCSNGLVQAPRG